MADHIGIVTASSLNVRPSPSTDQPALAQLPRGARLRILARPGSWLQIESGQTSGFVHADFVRILDSEPVSGFLADREDLQAVPLEPSPDRRIPLTRALTPDQRRLAGAWNGEGGLLQTLSDLVEVDRAAALAVITVESSGAPFAPDGRMTIRFENHRFFKDWGKDHPDVFQDHFQFDPDKPWKAHRFRAAAADPFAPFHGDQSREWTVFEFARALHEAAAMRSISMGLAQIMGFNHPRLGYDSVREMFDRFQASLRFQVLGLFDFVKGPGTTSPLLEALQRRRFDQFAVLYNGPGQSSEYSSRLDHHCTLATTLLP